MAKNHQHRREDGLYLKSMAMNVVPPSAKDEIEYHGYRRCYEGMDK